MMRLGLSYWRGSAWSDLVSRIGVERFGPDCHKGRARSGLFRLVIEVGNGMVRSVMT